MTILKYWGSILFKIHERWRSSFKLGNKCDQDEIINMTRAWDKGKSESLRESNPWPAEHRAGALSTDLQELTESEEI